MKTIATFLTTMPLSFSAVAGAADASPGKPNILWISCEDTSPDLGCYCDRYATTPNLDKFAAEGCQFDRAYVTFPVCKASEAVHAKAIRLGYKASKKN